MLGITHHHGIVGGEFPLLQDLLQWIPGRCIRRSLTDLRNAAKIAGSVANLLPQVTQLKATQFVGYQGDGSTSQQVKRAVRKSHHLRKMSPIFLLEPI
eukprot:Skav217027  [mRNA]  locus=scaffold1803:332519:332812:+ [translate_table: standard]